MVFISNTINSAVEVQLMEEVGHGTFSRVFKGKIQEKYVAVKVLNTVVDCIRMEVSYMRMFHHPNIISFYGTIQTDRLVILTEYMDSSLDNLLYNQQQCPVSLQFELTCPIKVHISLEIAKGIKYLQSLNLIHGDVKPENILVSADLKVKLSDFGLTKKPTEFSENIHGTPNYLPPETFLYNEYNITCDIYAFSMVIWQIFTQRLLYVKYESMDDLSLEVVHGERPILNKMVPEVYHKLLTDMWSNQIEQRPNIEKVIKILSLGYLEEIDNDSVKNAWRCLCPTQVLDYKLSLHYLNTKGNFKNIFRGIDFVSVNDFNFACNCFGNIWDASLQRKINEFIKNTHLFINWTNYTITAELNKTKIVIKEDLFSDSFIVGNGDKTYHIKSLWEL
ncbi:hypothetical protein ENUP19_0149G0030 [Entamoeba nuttalli]|uniref:Protein kinase, putative n=2 Tax=Entamoeba nuttalli TaxID=412467 RepID=K2GDX0_ENTNP|nr:protein kinase, putative [Entamoeba nuttalli P19]EKE40766.1 protein kinase, putative [Entamoeba nuttalli P19]|eukprot:XP_008856904.1 protein kinase, putative [Entamoeba nuttalli P19]